MNMQWKPVVPNKRSPELAGSLAPWSPRARHQDTAVLPNSAVSAAWQTLRIHIRCLDVWLQYLLG